MSLDPITLDPHDDAASTSQAAQALNELERLKAEMQERFHLYEEIQALPPADRDALFDILWEAQTGNPQTLRAIYDLVYDEIPVSMEEFVLGKRFLGLKGLINQEKIDLLVQFANPAVRKVWVAAGSGSGKSFSVSIVEMWVIYNLLCLKRPDLFYSLGPGSRIACVNLSVSRDQARDVVFAELRARLQHSPWFRGRYEATASRVRFQKEIYAISGGKKATSYYGYHTIMGALDEASFILEGETEVAADLIEALLKSLNTRFPRAYKLFVISTLRSPDDFLHENIQRIKEEGVCLLNRPTIQP